jgi:hypothetical protein
LIAKPTRIRSKKVIQECRKNYCEHCGGKATGEPHHIRPRSLGGSDIPENLIQLCFDCHRAAHDGKILYPVFVAIVAKREDFTIEEVCTRIGWPVPEEVKVKIPGSSTYTLDELIQLYISEQENEDDSRWIKGAVCLAITEGMGVSIRRTASWLGCSAAQVRELAKTFKAFPDETKRILSLSWRHHRIAANTDNPEKWITLAADNEWSTRQMQENVDIAKGKIAKEDLQLKKAEKAFCLAEEVLKEGGAPAFWLVLKLRELLDIESISLAEGF